MTRIRFRQLIGAQIVATVSALVAMWFPQYSQPLIDAYANEPMPFPDAYAAPVLALLIAGLAANVAVVAGLFLFRRWARSLSLWLTVAGVALIPFAGASLFWGLENALWEISTLLWGAILAAAYWSPVRKAFGDDATQITAQAEM